ncbi:MAG: ABC transporter permease [Bryobacteraceae bacterium]|nr:ABC transporter permease [Bryobacteraceae bacterium]
MRASTLVGRSLTYYWRTNLAVVAGVAVAVAVLAGALLVGDSVRGSLRELALRRLGNAGQVIGSSTFFRDELSRSFEGACPMIALEGLVTHQSSGRRASGVLVYGIDERFWSFHQRPPKGPRGREGLLSESLASELGVQPGEGVLLRIEKPSAIPAESLHGRKENAAAVLRFSFAEALAPVDLGEFALAPRQGSVRAVFVPLERLQAEIAQPGKVNTLLLPPGAEAPESKLRSAFRLEDLGLRLKPFQLASDAGLLADNVTATAGAAAEELGLETRGVFTYLANTIRLGKREVPYSLVTATDLDALAPRDEAGIVLNDWTARQLDARSGDAIELDFYVWQPDGRLATGTAKFEVDRIAPLSGPAADRELAPEFPGITDSENVADWDPPFPIDLGRIRPQDEDYWDRYRATPKAFIQLQTGQRLWESRYGNLTSLRFAGAGEFESYRSALRRRIDPLQTGFFILPVREQALAASRGATDFGEYFVYFSFFLVVSALMLAGLFFRLGIEQRIREIGALEAAGFSPAQVRRIFTIEGAALAAAGSLAGMLLSLGFAGLILHGLRTWWVDAVGTRLLTLHVNLGSIAAGGVAVVAAALLSVAGTLFSLRRLTPRERLAGVTTPPPKGVSSARSSLRLGALSAIAALALLAGAARGLLSQTAGFFGAGSLLLIALLLFVRALAARRPRDAVSSVNGLGFRSISYRPGRTVLCTALIASATFIIVAVDAFRQRTVHDPYDPRSGSAGYPLIAESTLPIYHNPATSEGKAELNLDGLDGVEFASFRLRPGDDVSCLNLYQPRNPRVLGAPPDFVRQAAADDDAWALIEQPDENGAAPAIVAANSLTYVLHRKIGDEFTLPGAGAEPVRFRIAGVLGETVFQRELIISERNFQRLFPNEAGYRVFLLKGPRDSVAEVSGRTEEALADYGFDAVPAVDRLEEFHRVENTYISTFQALGALGLLLGTLGLAAVLLRNVLERRRELALLRAVGFRTSHLARMVLAENGAILALGLGCGVAAALVAILPAFVARSGSVSPASLAWLVPVFAAGLLSSAAATLAVVRLRLLESLRSE